MFYAIFFTFIVLFGKLVLRFLFYVARFTIGLNINSRPTAVLLPAVA